MRAAIALALTLACASLAHGAALEVTVRDERGTAVENAVVYAMPRGGPAPAGAPRSATIEQIDKTFVPHVTVVQTGTTVQFPNRDAIRHHVYSFSAAKPFEIKLYAGTPPAPVVFDKPGEVVLGCNIHDNMLAFVLVVDTPWFAKTGRDGTSRLQGLPAGEFDVHVWHPALAARVAPRAIRLREDESAPFAAAVTLKALPARAPPK